MRRIFFVAVGIVIDIADDDSVVCSPVEDDPLDELTARLRREACHGRDSSNPGCPLPNVTAWMAAAYHECPDRN